MKTKIFVLTMVILLISANTLSYALDPTEGNMMHSDVVRLFREKKYDEALGKSLALMKYAQDHFGYLHENTAVAYELTAMIYEKINHFPNAERFYLKALSVRIKNGQPANHALFLNMNHIGRFYFIRGDFLEAERYQLQALATYNSLSQQNPRIITGLYNNLGSTYHKLNNYSKADHFFWKTIELHEGSKEKDRREYAIVCNNYAQLNSDFLKFGKAETYFKKGLSFLNENQPEYITLQNNLALLYQRTSEYAKSEALFRSAVSLCKKNYGILHAFTATSLNNLGNLYRITGAYPQAKELIEEALGIRKTLFGDSDLATLESSNNLAALFFEISNFGMSEMYYTEVLKHFKEKDKQNAFLYRRTLENLGFLYLETNDIDKAEAIFRQTDDHIGLGRCFLQRGDYLSAKNWFANSASIHAKKGLVELTIGDAIGYGLACEGLNEITEAKKAFAMAIDLISKTNQKLSFELRSHLYSGRVGHAFFRLDAYEGLIRVILKIGLPGHFFESLEIVEKNKNRIIVDMLRSRDYSEEKKDDDTLLSMDKEFQYRIFSLEKEMMALAQWERNDAKERIRNIQETLWHVKGNYEKFLRDLKMNQNSIGFFLNFEMPSLEKIQGRLEEHEAIITYFIGKKDTYAWVISKDNVRVKRIHTNEKEIATSINEFFIKTGLNNIKRSDRGMLVHANVETSSDYSPKQVGEDAFLGLSKTIFDFLLAPILTGLEKKKIIIAPHGAMHKIPFAALFDGERFLVDRYELVIVPSVYILEYLSEKKHNKKQNIVAFGNPKTGFPELQHAEEEIKKISSLFPTSKTLVRENANESEIKNLPPIWDVIHFACHAEFSEKQPLQSGLFLAAKGGEDGFFQVHEIFSLKLGQVSLVSLSACETGLSRVGGGDDLIGLAIAFMYAGSPSILSTLWSVDDRSTSLLMERFYENWVKKNMSKSASLRDAQIYLRSMPEYRNPFFWGAFQLTGRWE